MRAIDSKLFVVSAEVDREVDDYRAAVPAIRNAKSIVFRKPVTMLIGENVVTEIDRLGVTRGYGGQSLHEQSHGESFMALLLNRFLGDGLYVLDEPEAALSPMRQLSMLARIHDLVNGGSQFIIATHSPILMAYPDATLLLMEQTIREVAYEETEHYTVMRDFFNHRAAMLRELMA